MSNLSQVRLQVVDGGTNNNVKRAIFASVDRISLATRSSRQQLFGRGSDVVSTAPTDVSEDLIVTKIVFLEKDKCTCKLHQLI